MGFLSPFKMLQYSIMSSLKDNNGFYDPQFVSIPCKEEKSEESMLPGNSVSDFPTGLSNLDESNMPKRAQREFVPDNRKDNAYWSRRFKNNDSARKSRLKRKALEKYMEQKLFDLQKENATLKMELATLRQQFANKSSDDKNYFVADALNINPRNMKADIKMFMEKHDIGMYEMDTEGAEISKNEDASCQRLISRNRSQFSEGIRSQDLNSEGSCSPVSSETNDSSNAFNHPLDLSSGSTSSSPNPDEKRMVISSSNGDSSENKTDLLSVKMLPYKFRLKMYEHSAFSG